MWSSMVSTGVTSDANQGSLISIIGHTCADPTVSYQNGCSEEGLLWV